MPALQKFYLCLKPEDSKRKSGSFTPSKKMHIHLDNLFGLPNVTVFTCYQKEGFLILELELINQ